MPLLRRRPAAPDAQAAARLAGLRSGGRDVEHLAGWVPHAPAARRSALPPQPESPAAQRGEQVQPHRWDEDPEPPAAVPPPTPRRSWSFDEASGGALVEDSAERPPTLLQRLRAGRVDPGRRGVAALVLVAVVGAAVTGAVVLRGRPHTVQASTVLAPGAPVGVAATGAPSASPAAVLVVAVSGDVRRPGIVRLPSGSRVDDAVRAAGGAEDPRDLALVNLARKVADGEQVVIGRTAPGAGSGAGPSGAGESTVLDLNAATAEDLDALPGIGPVLAQKIVDYRTENNGFASVDQLREVSGIGESRYADLRSLVRV